MKNKLLFIIFLTLTMATQAKVWRVNNKQGISADFTNFTSAQNASSPNDTLYFEGSTLSYGNIVITKPLVMMGPGYFISENPQTQANIVSAKFGTIDFNTGSAGTTLMSLEIQGATTINVSDVSVIRCLANYISLNSSVSSIGNILILGNYIRVTTSFKNGIYSIGSNQIFNLLANNNFVWRNSEPSVKLGTNVSGKMNNNVFGDVVDVFNFSFANNIFNTYVYNITDNVFYNNIFYHNYSQLPIGNKNKLNISIYDVFVGTTGNSTDGQWKLKAGSPAIGAGNDGTDCGMFGGPTPYVLSGLPSIPSIYEITMPAAGTSESGINVTIKAKVNP